MQINDVLIHLLGGIKKELPILTVLEDFGMKFITSSIEVIRKDSILVMNADFYIKNFFETKVYEKNSLLLFDVSEEQKEIIGKDIGIHLPLDSEAYFISFKMKGKSKECYINDFPKKIAITNCKDEESYEIIENYCKNILGIHSIDDFETEIPVENFKWIYSYVIDAQCYEDHSWHAEDSTHKYTPRDQSCYGEITFTIWAFLDKEGDNTFQWIYMNCKGIWNTSRTGNMNFDNDNEKGWFISQFNISIEHPVGEDEFHYYSCSPTNANNQSEVTSSIGFEIGTGGATYNFSDSQTETIQDWEIRLDKTNKWAYMQKSPFTGGKSEIWDAIKYKFPNFRLKHLPTLSKKCLDFDTMSVWKNNKKTDKYTCIKVDMEIEFCYEALTSRIGDYSGYFWFQGRFLPFWLKIDLGKVN